MRYIILFVFLTSLFNLGIAQIGTIQTEQHQADFEKKQSIEDVADYHDTIRIPIQNLKIGINEALYAMYPELKDKLGLVLVIDKNDLFIIV